MPLAGCYIRVDITDHVDCFGAARLLLCMCVLFVSWGGGCSAVFLAVFFVFRYFLCLSSPAPDFRARAVLFFREVLLRTAARGVYGSVG